MNGFGSGYGSVGHGKMGMAVPVAPAPPPPVYSRRAAEKEAPSVSREESRDDRGRSFAKGDDKKGGKDEDAKTKSKGPAAVTWTVTASNASGVGGTAPLVEAIRAALASGRASCLAASQTDVGKPIRVRLTVDAQGRIVRVELITGDRNAAHCLRAALAGLSSATVANGTTPAAATAKCRPGRWVMSQSTRPSSIPKADSSTTSPRAISHYSRMAIPRRSTWCHKAVNRRCSRCWSTAVRA